ncbi:MAG: histidinol-phosphate transaminase [Planctomycetota bacterium]|nr:MAG: histidinol-phosphate transaminase [Planctomycetota bacterium]
MTYFRNNIERMEGYTPGEQPEDPAIIKLNTNENPYSPSPKVMEMVASITPDQLRRYPDPLGNQFRDAAAKVFDVTRDHIICGNGMDDILNMSVRAFSGPDAALVYPKPTYTLYAVLANIQASVVREVPFPPDYSLPLGELVAARGRVTYLANPNSPTGTFVPYRQVAELADKLAGVLCVDEAYVDFAREHCMELAKIRPNVLVMRTMSKGYSLAGLRFGFAVGHPDLIEGLMKVKDSYNVDAIGTAAATAALVDQDYYEQTRKKVIAERDRLAAALEKLGLPCLPSESNFLLARAKKPSAAQLYESLKDRRILVRYFDSPGVSDTLRITVGTHEQNNALINALTELTSG